MNRTKRVEASERKQPDIACVWHRLIWDVGQPWDDVLTQYGAEKIAPEDNIILHTVVGADNGKPARDPTRERDKPKADA